MMRHAILAMILSGALALGAPSAGAESTKDRVGALEAAVADLQARAPAAADTAVRIGRLEQEIQRLTGDVERLTHELDQANARLNAVSAALSGGGPATGAPTALSGGDPIADKIAQSGGPSAPAGEIALPLDPDLAFDYASSFLVSGDYASARKAFELYVKAFPNHPRTAEAQFRLGEIYLATGANAEAADAFIAHIKKYPNDARAAEAYLKLGTAFSRLNQGGEACKVFKTMRAKYPNASPAVLQRADIEMQRINCK